MSAVSDVEQNTLTAKLLCLQCDCFNKLSNKSEMSLSQNEFRKINTQSPIYAVPHQNASYTNQNLLYNSQFTNSLINQQCLAAAASSFACSSSSVSLSSENDDITDTIEDNCCNDLNKNKDDDDNDKMSTSTTTSCSSWTPMMRLSAVAIDDVQLNKNSNYMQSVPTLSHEINNNVGHYSKTKNNSNYAKALCKRNNKEADLLAELDQQIAELQVCIFMFLSNIKT